MKVAIKFTTKNTINRIFVDNGQPFSELEMLYECTSTPQISNIIELIEGFEDAKYLYIVTKFVPAGDLLNYLIMQVI